MRSRGCLIAAAVALALAGAVAALLGPGLLRRARTIYAPIARMKGEQKEFESWTRQRPWQEPPTPRLDALRLDAFLALRRQLRALDEKGDGMRRRVPRGERARVGDVPAIVEGVGGLVSERLAAFRRHDITPDEYDYLERLVYGTWLRALEDAGHDPAARARAADEIERAAEEEEAAVQRRLRAVAAEVRGRVPPAPEGIPADLHRLLLSRAPEIEAQPSGRVAGRVPRLRERRRPDAPASP